MNKYYIDVKFSGDKHYTKKHMIIRGIKNRKEAKEKIEPFYDENDKIRIREANEKKAQKKN